MTNPRRTLIAVLLDRSGSMESVKSDTEGGFNAFVDAQRAEPGEALTLAQFDTEYEVVYANRPIADVPRLALQPRGGTALYDALGRLITDVGAELAAQPEDERPGTVIVVVLTDGHELEQEWTHAAVTAAIKRQEIDYAWDFIFLGANMYAGAVGTSLGFAADRSMTWDTDNGGAVHAMASTTAYVSRRRSAPAGAPVAGFSTSDREAASGRKRTCAPRPAARGWSPSPSSTLRTDPYGESTRDGQGVEGNSVRGGSGRGAALAAPAPPQLDGARRRHRDGTGCAQPTDPRIPIDLGAPQGDDCLTLNVWCSSDTQPGDGKPVMVWVHGGAYVLGSAAQALYDGARWLAAVRR
jgi:hypothetical protein